MILIQPSKFWIKYAKWQFSDIVETQKRDKTDKTKII